MKVKKLFLLGVALIMIFSFAACDSKEEWILFESNNCHEWPDETSDVYKANVAKSLEANRGALTHFRTVNDQGFV